MKIDDFVSIASDKLEETFPKGKCAERGQALLLITEMAIELKKHGVLSE